MRQACLIKRPLSEYSTHNSNPMSMPVCRSSSINSNQKEKPMNSTNRSIIGSLLYLAVKNRDYIATAGSVFGEHIDNPKTKHLVAAQRVLQHLQGTEKVQVTLSPGRTIKFICMLTQTGGTVRIRRDAAGRI